jgi:hypothetical protein
MIKIFLAVYIAGKSIGVLGPLPMDIDQCREMAGVMLSEQAKAAKVALVCEERK